MLFDNKECEKSSKNEMQFQKCKTYIEHRNFKEFSLYLKPLTLHAPFPPDYVVETNFVLHSQMKSPECLPFW